MTSNILLQLVYDLLPIEPDLLQRAYCFYRAKLHMPQAEHEVFYGEYEILPGECHKLQEEYNFLQSIGSTGQEN